MMVLNRSSHLITISRVSQSRVVFLLLRCIVAIFVSKNEGFDEGSAHMSLFLATRGEMRDCVIWCVGIMYDPAKGTTWWAGALRRRQEDKMQSYPY